VPAGNYVVQTIRAPRMLPRGNGNFTMVQAGGGMVAFSTRVEGGGGGGGQVTERSEPEPEPTLWTAMPVSTDGSPVNGVALTLQEGYTLSGRIEFEGAADRPTPDQMRRITIVADPVESRTSAIPAAGSVTEDGRFDTSGVLPGHYVLRAENAGQNWVLKSVMLGGIDVSESPLEVERAVTGVTVTFTDTPSNLTGIVRDSQGQPDPAAAVLVFPADNRLWIDYGTNPRRMRMVRPTETGSYSLRALPAGDYHVVAVGEEFAGEWEDPRFLEQVALQASRLTINDGGQHTHDLTTQPFRGITGGVPAPAEVPLAEGHGPFVPEPEAALAYEPAGVPASYTPRGQQARDSRTMPTTGTSRLSGSVVDDATGQPVRRARVSLRSAETRVDHAVMTDDTGRFSLMNLPAGRYSLTATKPAFVTAYYGSRRPGRGPGVPVALTDGSALDDVVMRMARGGVVSGRVTDEFGQPVPGASVRVMQERSGTPALVAGLRSAADTDDRGEYRVYGLAPGDYVVMVNPPRQSRSEIRQLTTSDVDAVLQDADRPASGPVDLGGRTVGFAPVYYPGTMSPSGATRVGVASGQMLENIDIPVQRVPTARIEGIITGPDGQPVQGVSALLLPYEDGSPVAITTTSVIQTDAEGRFTATNVVPGRYKLSARSSGAQGGVGVMQLGGEGVFIARRAWTATPGAPAEAPASEDPPTPLWAEAIVDVNGQDITGLALTMQEGMTISGRVVFEGDRPAPEELTGISVNVTPSERGGISLGVPGSQVNADGTFTIEGVTPGSYQLRSTVPASGFTPDSPWQMKSAMVDGRDTLDTNLEVLAGQPPSDVVLTFTDRQTALTGTVLDPADAPVSDLTILVFPANPEFWSPTSRRMPQPQQPDSNGQFRFEGLPPGEYRLAAVTEIEDGNWGDPAYMEQVAAAGIPLTLAEGEAKVQDLRIGGGQ
jgi:protocatechuate 3,4-dioxygenase beta subunit